MPLVPLKRLPSEDDQEAPAPRTRPTLVARGRPSQDASGARAVSPSGATAKTARLDNLSTDFPDLIKAEVDLVEELEQILRGDIDATDADFSRRPEPCDDDPDIEGPTALDSFLGVDPWDDDESSTAPIADHRAPVPGEFRNRTRPLVPHQAERQPQARFWRAGTEGTTAAMISDRRRRGPRSDVIIISALVLLIAGGGAYSAFHDWTPDDGGTPALAEANATAAAAPAVPETAALPPPAAEAPPAGVVDTPPPAAPEAAQPPEAPTTPAGEADPFAVEPRTVAVVPVPADNIPPTPPADAATPDGALETPTPPTAPDERVATTPEPIDLLNQTPLAEPAAAGEPPPPEPEPEPPAPAEPEPAVVTPPPPDPEPTPQPAPARAERTPEPAAPAAAPNTPVGGGMVAVAETWVNMRAGPSSGSRVIRVVEPGMAVTVVSCDYWCEVVVDGTTGWIYQDFLRANR